MRLTAEQRRLLQALASGSTLKVYRTVDGAKVYKLHALAMSVVEEIAPAVVERLHRQRLIESNMKFPAAVFLLTDKGAAEVARNMGAGTLPVGPRRFDSPLL